MILPQKATSQSLFFQWQYPYTQNRAETKISIPQRKFLLVFCSKSHLTADLNWKKIESEITFC